MNSEFGGGASTVIKGGGGVSSITNADGSLTFVPSSGAVVGSVATNGVTYAKFQQVAASSLVGNATGSLANATGITLAAPLKFTGTTLDFNLANSNTWTVTQTFNGAASTNSINSTCATATGNGGAAGGWTFNSGAGNSGSSVQGGAASIFTINGAAGGAVGSGSVTGGAGSSVAITLGNGGAGTGSPGANAGNGGAWTVTAGQGGLGGSGSTASNGGNGSAITFTGSKGGNGGSSSSNGAAGTGSTFTVTTGLGGNGATGGGLNGGSAGAGGAVSFTTGNGGSAGGSGAGNTNGGNGANGGAFNITTGNGSNGANGSGSGAGGSGGNSGSITIQTGTAGAAGTGGTGVAGTVGDISLQATRGLIGLGIAAGSVTALAHIGASTATRASLRLAAGTAPTSPNNGDDWNDSTQNMRAFYNGNTLYQSGNLYTATADVTITSASPVTTLSGTKIGTTTIAASTLKVGQKFLIWGAGYYSTPIGNTATVTITAKIGSVTISTVTTGALPSGATNLPFDFNLQCTIRGTGASATLVADGTFNYATALSAVAKTSNSLSTVGTITFDSTAAQAIDVQANWSAVTTQTATVQQSKIDFL